MFGAKAVIFDGNLRTPNWCWILVPFFSKLLIPGIYPKAPATVSGWRLLFTSLPSQTTLVLSLGFLSWKHKRTNLLRTFFLPSLSLSCIRVLYVVLWKYSKASLPYLLWLLDKTQWRWIKYVEILCLNWLLKYNEIISWAHAFVETAGVTNASLSWGWTIGHMRPSLIFLCEKCVFFV